METEILGVVANQGFRDAVLVAAGVATLSLLGVIVLMARELVDKHKGDHWHCKVSSLDKPFKELIKLQTETNKLLREQNGKATRALLQGETTLKAVGKLLDRQFELAALPKKGG